MILVFGGAYQGKLAYTLERFGLTRDDVYYCDEKNNALPENKKIIYEIDKWIFALVKANSNVDEVLGQFIKSNGEAVVICNDISCGVVPADPQLRAWREAVGHSMAQLSRTATEVVRLFCGIATEIK